MAFAFCLPSGRQATKQAIRLTPPWRSSALQRRCVSGSPIVGPWRPQAGKPRRLSAENRGSRGYGYLHEMLLQHPIEEETMPLYDSTHYYPVNIGDVYAERYQVIGKLGYGAHSTSWLCQDKKDGSFKAVKISTCLQNFPDASNRELSVYQHIAQVSARSKHPGRHLIRSMHDSFEIDGPSGKHRGLVLSPMYTTIREHARNHKGALLPIPKVKRLTRNLLWVLDFLHSEASVVHTDLKTDNLMLTIEDGGMLSDYVREEQEQPSERRETSDGRGIYRSRGFRAPKAGLGCGTTLLCDFGDARVGSVQAPMRGVQPVVYRAPEIIFEMAWGTAADIWNLAGLVWEMVQGDRVFRNIVHVSGSHDVFKHVARMVAMMGKPPNMFLQRSKTTALCFDSDGTWIANNEAEVPVVCLDSLEQRYGSKPENAQDREEFLNFIQSMLQWLPEQRRTAKELLHHPWLSHTR